MVFTMFAAPVFATDIEDGSEAYVTVGKCMNVIKIDTVQSIMLCTKMRNQICLEAHINWCKRTKEVIPQYTKVQLKDGYDRQEVGKQKKIIEAAEDFKKILNESCVG